MASKIKKRFVPMSDGGHNVFTTLPPSANEWNTMAENANHLVGKGNQIIPITSFTSGGYFSDTEVAVPLYKQDRIFEMVVFPRRESTTRTWHFYRTKNYHSWDLNFPASGIASLNNPALAVSGAIVSSSAGGTIKLDMRNQPVIQFVSGTESSAGNIGSIYALTMSAIGSGLEPQHVGHMSWFGCFEHDQKFISSATGSIECGDIMSPGRPVRDTGIKDNVRGVLRTTNESLRETRKAGLWYYVRPLRVDGVLNTVSGALPVDPAARTFAGGLGIPVQTRRFGNSLTGSVEMWFLIHGTLNTTMNIHITSSWTDATVIEKKLLTHTIVDTGVPVWINTTIDIVSDSTGSAQLNDKGDGQITFSRNMNAGDGTAYIASICIGEKDVFDYTSL